MCLRHSPHPGSVRGGAGGGHIVSDAMSEEFIDFMVTFMAHSGVVLRT